MTDLAAIRERLRKGVRGLQRWDKTRPAREFNDALGEVVEALARLDRLALLADTPSVEPAGLDGDDLDSILLALGQLPTWFPETAAKVEAMRAALPTQASDSPEKP